MAASFFYLFHAPPSFTATSRLKGWCIMSPIRQELTAFTRACERLLSQEGSLNEDERSLLEYYVNDLSRQFLPDKQTVQLPYNETVAVKRASEA
jgi:hypothetical protein